jgi:glycine betaine/proline transport system permease protein
VNADVGRPRHLLVAGAVLVGLAAVGGFAAAFPESLGLPLADWAEEFQRRVIRGRSSSVLFAGVFRPAGALAGGASAAVLALFTQLGWVGVLAMASGVALLTAGRRVAVTTFAALTAIGLIGRWDDAMLTLALTTVAVLVAVGVGLPLGVVAGRSPRIARSVRPLLDTLQIVPAYVYLLPVVLLFGIGESAAVVVTVLYALPPIVRLTALGLRSVPAAALEVATSCGTTRPQLLRTVQLPLALPWIRIGINQTIMMALGMVVIASLVGARGLGREVLRGLQTLDIGRALDAGIAIVLLAVVLDRMTTSAGRRRVDRPRGPEVRRVLLGTGLVAVASVVLPSGAFPAAGSLSLASAATSAAAWSRTALYGATSSLADGLIRGALDPLRDLLTATPWWLLTAVVLVLVWWLGEERLAPFVVLSLATVGALGVWAETMNTLSQVIVATILAVLFAIPIGVLASRHDPLDRALRPALDAMQTLPAFVYLVPVVALFDVGRVPGLIATVVYALPPAVRMTNAGIRNVDAGIVEAARSQGATAWQLLRTVQLPLARPTILMGVNQTTIMVLAGVIIAGLVGASGLGIETVIGVARGEFGRGVRAGVAVVLVGVLLDRLTQGLAGGVRGPRAAALIEEARARIRTA